MLIFRRFILGDKTGKYSIKFDVNHELPLVLLSHYITSNKTTKPLLHFVKEPLLYNKQYFIATHIKVY